MPRRNIVPARNRRVERLAEAIAHARRQELIGDLGWLFINEPPDEDVEETSNLFRQDDKVAKGSADVSCVLGRESANIIRLDGVAKGSADVPCVLGRESANLIGLDGGPRAAPMYPEFSEESRLVSSGWKERPKSSVTNDVLGTMRWKE